jgi:hypothetical protein
MTGNGGAAHSLSPNLGGSANKALPAANRLR